MAAPTPLTQLGLPQIAQIGHVVRDLRAAMTRELFADWVDAIAERTETDPARDMYPRLVAAVIRVVGETAMEVYAYADPPVAYTELLRRGLADVAAGLPER